jgi:hypothetical protein
MAERKEPSGNKVRTWKESTLLTYCSCNRGYLRSKEERLLIFVVWSLRKKQWRNLSPFLLQIMKSPSLLYTKGPLHTEAVISSTPSISSSLTSNRAVGFTFTASLLSSTPITFQLVQMPPDPENPRTNTTHENGRV